MCPIAAYQLSRALELQEPSFASLFRAIMYTADFWAPINISVPIRVGARSQAVSQLAMEEWIPIYTRVKLDASRYPWATRFSLFLHSHQGDHESLTPNRTVRFLTDGEFLVHGDMIVVRHTADENKVLDAESGDITLAEAFVIKLLNEGVIGKRA